jgi:hypothetical protein
MCKCPAMKSGCILLSNLGVGLLDEDEYSK